MRRLSISLLALFLLSADAGAQEYIQQQTGAQCAARGGRITQWMSSIDVDPPVGTCFVPTGSALADHKSDDVSEGDDPSESRSAQKSDPSCKLMYRSYDRLNHLPRTNGLVDECNAFKSEIRIMEETLRYFPCHGDSGANEIFPTMIREQLQDAKRTASEVCRMAAAAPQETNPAPTTSARLSPSVPSVKGELQSPGAASNCIAIRQDQVYRQFTLTNECAGTISFRLQSTNFDGTRVMTNVSLAPRGNYQVISYRGEDPIISEPRTPIESARDELIVLQKMKIAIDAMPNGPEKEVQEKRFVKLLTQFAEKTRSLR